MKETHRKRQVGDVVRGELARLLREDLRDPDIGFATITDVLMAGDLRSARVFVSVLGPADQFSRTVNALNHAAGHLRGLVGRNCGLRYAPDLHFVEDHSLERGARIEEILRSLPADEQSDESDERDERDDREDEAKDQDEREVTGGNGGRE